MKWIGRIPSGLTEVTELNGKNTVALKGIAPASQDTKNVQLMES